MRIFTLSTIMIFLATLVSAQEWTELNTFTSEDLTCVFFTDENTGFVGTKDPEIWMTSDGGANWQSMVPGAMSSSGTEWIQDIYFHDQNNGWLVAYSGGATNYPMAALLKTTDGGQNWTTIIDDDSTNLNAIYFADANNGWAVGEDGLIMHSSNGGDSWTIQQSATQDYQLYDVYFTDMNNGWAVGGEDNLGGTQEGYIYRTTNGGQNWTLQETADQSLADNAFRTITFADASNAWSDNRLSTDGGETWTDQGAMFGSDVSFANSNNGWYITSWGVEATSDGGSNWEVVVSNDSLGGSLGSVHAINPSTAYAVGTDGVVVKKGDLSSSLNEITEVEKFEIFPNPFKEQVKITYELMEPSTVHLDVVDMRGKVLNTIVSDEQNSGAYQYKIQRGELNLSAGTYFVRLSVNGKIASEQLMHLK